MFSTILGLACVILNIFAINDVLHSSRDMVTKIVLIAIILVIPFIGAGLYLFAFRKKEYA